MKVILQSPKGKCKMIKWGVSWTYLIFGGWALIFSGRWLFVLIEIILNVLIAAAGIGIPLTGVYHLFLFLFGNKTYARHLINKGWVPADDRSRTVMSM